MFKTLRFISALGAVFFASLALAACGGGIPSDAVVQVGSNPITKATFEHWLSVAAASSATTATAKTAPSRSSPIRRTTRNASRTWKRPRRNRRKASPSRRRRELKSECEQQYTSLKQEVLGFLISSEWVIGEAANLGVKVSDAEVKKEFEKIKNQQFPKAAEFEKFLATSGQTVSDLLLRVKLNMLSSKIQQKIAKEQGHAQQSRNRKVLQGKHVPLRHAGKAQRGDHPHEDRSGSARKPRRKSNRARASRASPKPSRSTRRARPRAACWSA